MTTRTEENSDEDETSSSSIENSDEDGTSSSSIDIVQLVSIILFVVKYFFTGDNSD